MKNYKINSKKKFEEYDKELQENKFFMMTYFSQVESSIKEYKFIPKECLDDKYFVFSCLDKNPDIYLLADKVHSNDMFLYLKDLHRNNFLKYASKEQIEDKSFCIKAIEENPFNYPYLPLDVRADKVLIKRIFTKLVHPHDVASSIPLKIVKDRDFMFDLMKENIDVFYGIKRHYKKDREIMTHLVLSSSSLFSEADDELKADPTWVNEILAKKRHWEKNYNYHALRDFRISDIISELPKNFFEDETFVLNNLKEIADEYKGLKKEVRACEVLVKSLYSNHSVEILPKKLDYLMDKHFIKKIPIEDLKNKLLEFGNSNVFYNNEEEKIVDFKKFITLADYYFLEKTLDSNQVKSDMKKIKI